MSIVSTAIGRVVVAVLFLTLGMIGCQPDVRHVRGYDCSDLRDKYLQKPRKTLIAEFGDHDIEKQYAIYICGNQYMHPPFLGLADAFAEEGAKVVGFLKTRLLEAEGDDSTVRDIVYVFSEMQRLKTYDVIGDDDLMRIMVERVRMIKSDGWREISERRLSRIRG